MSCAVARRFGLALPRLQLAFVLLTMRTRPAPGRAAGARGESADLLDLRRCLGGDGEAYRAIVERHQAMVARLMWRFSRDPEAHEELVQEVFVAAYESLPRFRATGPFAHWLARIATRVGYAYWKRQKRDRRTELVAPEDLETVAAGEPEESIDYARAAELLHRLLATLRPRDRLVLTLRYVEGRSVEETAALTGWSETMVKVQALRARAKLRDAYARADGEGDPCETNSN